MPDFTYNSNIDNSKFGVGAPQVATVDPSIVNMPLPTGDITNVPSDFEMPPGMDVFPATVAQPSQVDIGTTQTNLTSEWYRSISSGRSPVRRTLPIGQYRHFTALLYNNLSGTPNITSVQFNVNPEDFSIDTPYRVNATQTMEGAFVDIWGQGIVRLSMRGHTGWRTVLANATQQQDGFDNIFALKEQIIDQYFKLRKDNSSSYSQSDLEDKLQVHIVDKLHQKVHYVVPEMFKLFRNKSRPLLHMYEMSFIVQLEESDRLDASANNPNTIGNTGDPKGFWGQLGDKLKGFAKQMASNPTAAMMLLSSKGYGIGAFMQGTLDFGQPLQIDGLSDTVKRTFLTTASCMEAMQTSSLFSGLDIASKLSWMNTRQVLSDGATLIQANQSNGVSAYTNMVSSGGAAPVGSPHSPLEDSPNSFSLIKNSSQNDGIQTATNDLSVVNTTAFKTLNSKDPILSLIGR